MVYNGNPIKMDDLGVRLLLETPNWSILLSPCLWRYDHDMQNCTRWGDNKKQFFLSNLENNVRSFHVYIYHLLSTKWLSVLFFFEKILPKSSLQQVIKHGSTSNGCTWHCYCQLVHQGVFGWGFAGWWCSPKRLHNRCHWCGVSLGVKIWW